MTFLSWFDAKDAEDFGKRLADQFASNTAEPNAAIVPTIQKSDHELIRQLINKASAEADELSLNFFRKAKFANSFKWRLIERGVDKGTADDVTQALLVRLSTGGSSESEAVPTVVDRAPAGDVKSLLARANRATQRKEYSDAADFYQELVNFNPTHAVGFNNLGSVLIELGRYKEAEEQFRKAISIAPTYPDPHSNLGTLLRWRGDIAASEASLRQALRLKPNFVDARASLGITQMLLGQLRDAKAKFEKVLKVSRTNGDALLGMGQLAKMEGRFFDAESFFRKAFAANPKMTAACAALVSTRKMSVDDDSWLASAKSLEAEPLSPLQAADIAFAIGKYYDDVNKFELAFRSYKRANELLKPIADPYDRHARKSFVDDLIKAYSFKSIAAAKAGSSTSSKPIFVVGMMRSGTSLAEQIIASHRSVCGAGELDYWSNVIRTHDAVLRGAPPTAPLRDQLAEAYLNVLQSNSVKALRVIDKTPENSDYLGVIHSVFPNAKIIYMQRDPIDTCLSCYFQQFSPALNFSMDMSDIAHYYREHHRLIAHWRTVLPAGSILDVPYAELVANQEDWSRRILNFLELDWDAKVLDFTSTKRSVMTASSWQVRQKVYGSSVMRWRNYEKFLKPLVELNDLKA